MIDWECFKLKIEEEYEEFKTEILKKTKEEIFKENFRIYFYEALYDCVQDLKEFYEDYEKEIKLLNKIENPIEEIYEYCIWSGKDFYAFRTNGRTWSFVKRYCNDSKYRKRIKEIEKKYEEMEFSFFRCENCPNYQPMDAESGYCDKYGAIKDWNGSC